MRTTLVSVLLLTATVCSAQPARIRENTSGSWNFSNLSTENWRDFIVAGATDIDPATGLLCPTFKFVNPNLIPIGGPAPLPSYRLGYTVDRTMHDFVFNPNNGQIILTGTDGSTGGAPLTMYIAVIDAATGTPITTVLVPGAAGFSLIPHQVIYSSAADQYVIVGTKVLGIPNTSNYAVLPKTGFMLIVNAGLPLTAVNFIETETPSITGGNDSDMLESVTEVPGYGYFAGGSANGFASPAEQNVMVMNATYAGLPGPSGIMDNTSFRATAASVMHNPLTNQVIVLGNNSSFGTYELTRFTSVGVVPASSSVRHVLSCVSSTSFTNGFRLQQNAGGSQIIIGGYIWNPSGAAALLTPFQTTTNPGLTAVINAKLFQSANNSVLGTGYFSEAGSSVYINTPDIVTYHPNSNRTFLVSASTSVGFDMYRSTPAATLACEAACSFAPVSASWPFLANGVTYFASTPVLTAIPATLISRTLVNTVLCSSTPLAPINEEPAFGKDSGVQLFPNPATDKLEISTDATIVEAVVYDMNGNKVLEAVNEHASGIRLIDVSMLKSGVYIITLKAADGTLLRERFMKE